MTLEERLENVLTNAGIPAEHRAAWQRAIKVAPFEKAEVFVYILEHLEKGDIPFFDENLLRKMAATKAGSEDLFRDIFDDENKFLLQ
jgi:hypothetical protein